METLDSISVLATNLAAVRLRSLPHAVAGLAVRGTHAWRVHLN